MGNYCTEVPKSHHEVINIDTISGNEQVCQFYLNECKLSLILGSYRHHRADLLLIISQLESLTYSSEIKEYAQNYLELMEKVNNSKKRLVNVQVNQNCPYKRIMAVMIPDYKAHKTEVYYKEFGNIIEEILTNCSEFTFQVSQTPENGNGVPNQTMMRLLIEYLKSYKKKVKINIISEELRFLNMFRYEMAKYGIHQPLNYKPNED